LLEKEIKFIGGVVNNPNAPVVAILGGSKVSDKILLIKNLLLKADYILVGGGMMFTFLKAEGINIGSSLIEDEHVDFARKLLLEAKGKIILPIDVKVADSFSNDAIAEVVEINCIPDGMMGLDIGPNSVKLFKNYIDKANTVV